MIFRHYKGGLYRVLFDVQDSTNGAHEKVPMVVYVSLTTGQAHVRDRDEFYGRVADGQPRFQRTP